MWFALSRFNRPSGSRLVQSLGGPLQRRGGGLDCGEPRCVLRSVALDERGRRLDMSVIPYENFDPFHSYLAPKFKVFVEVLLQRGFHTEGFLVDFRKPVAWDEYPRTFQYRLHAWEPIS